MRGEHVQIWGRVRIPLLLLVARDEGRVEMLVPGVIQLIDHPAVAHPSIVSSAGPACISPEGDSEHA